MPNLATMYKVDSLRPTTKINKRLCWCGEAIKDRFGNGERHQLTGDHLIGLCRQSTLHSKLT
jgi:hypothetical protein